MILDLLSAVLRGLGFLAILQAGGALLFLAAMQRHMASSRQGTLRLVRRSALAGMLLLVAQYLLEPARMSGAVSGILDTSLHGYLLHTNAALALLLRAAGLVLLLLAVRNDGAWLRSVGIAGALLAAASFAATGHTSHAPDRWLLGPLLGLHVLIVQCWFGALLPLRLVAARETSAVATFIVRQFSRFATWTVPAILVAGVLIAWRLLPDATALARPYGIGLLFKLLVFALLLGIAAFNKWRLAPALEHGGQLAARRFRRSVEIEFALLAAVLLGTATLTTFWSPGH